MTNDPNFMGDPAEGDAPSNSVVEPLSTNQATAKFKAWAGMWAIAFSIAVGLLSGVGTFTFGYGKGTSYLSNNPQACVNCHVMQSSFDSWQQSGHHHVATCNDCHLPHDPIGKWITKADNGFFHSLAFTFGGFKDPIQIKARNRQVTQSTCVHCHQDFVHNLLPDSTGQEPQLCIHCHANVGHAER